MLGRNAADPEDKRIVFRIGINIGIILIDGGDDTVGDGVNIAARLDPANNADLTRSTACGDMYVSDGIICRANERTLATIIETCPAKSVKTAMRSRSLTRSATPLQ